MTGHLLFIEYEGGPLKGMDEAVKSLPPRVIFASKQGDVIYYPTGRVNARGRHVYTTAQEAP